MTFPIVIRFVHPTDARGWIGFGCYLLVIGLLVMMWADKSLLRDDFFKVIATAIILTGWNQGPVGWAYQSTKSGNELSASSQRIAEAAAGLPEKEPPKNAKEVADQVADAAVNKAGEFKTDG